MQLMTTESRSPLITFPEKKQVLEMSFPQKRSNSNTGQLRRKEARLREVLFTEKQQVFGEVCRFK